MSCRVEYGKDKVPIYVIDDSSDDDEERTPFKKRSGDKDLTRPDSYKKAKLEPQTDDEDDDDDIIEVDPAPKRVLAPMPAGEEQVNDEVAIVGLHQDGAMTMPHCRSSCIVNKFNASNKEACLKAICDLCYCFVCDVPVKDCQKWNEHCLADHKSPIWQRQRKIQRASKFQPSNAMPPPVTNINGHPYLVPGPSSPKVCRGPKIIETTFTAKVSLPPPRRDFGTHGNSTSGSFRYERIFSRPSSTLDKCQSAKDFAYVLGTAPDVRTLMDYVGGIIIFYEETVNFDEPMPCKRIPCLTLYSQAGAQVSRLKKMRENMSQDDSAFCGYFPPEQHEFGDSSNHREVDDRILVQILEKAPGTTLFSTSIQVTPPLEGKSEFNIKVALHFREQLNTSFDGRSAKLLGLVGMLNRFKGTEFQKHAKHFLPKVAREPTDISSSKILKKSINYGREGVNQPKGLKARALPFQLQSMSWMLDVERKGIKLSAPIELNGKTFYGSIVTKYLTMDKPKSCRGGFLCEEMGLGKTIITLGISLLNPSTITAPIHRGGKLASRGTLVVCAVSLVSQWVSEAKKHLRGDIQLYAYHGQNRSRNSEVLANQDIVVTTYATLSSDASYWKKKSDASKGYVSPLESIIWHRIVLDESHSIKSPGTKMFKAIMALEGIHKWCVTGTPITGTVQDLQTQLQFLGLESIAKQIPKKRTGIMDAEVFNLFPNFMMRHISSQNVNGVPLLQLPKKTENTVYVEFDKNEQKLYEELHGQAKKLFDDIEAGGKVRKQTLVLLSILLPLRQACSGGGIFSTPAQANKALSSTNGMQLDCGHCGELATEPVKTKCNHVFCKECIKALLHSGIGKEPCPTCQKDVEEKHLEDVGSASCSHFKDLDQTAKKISEVFHTKIDVLMSTLKNIRQQDPQAKILIFSQFQATLNKLEKTLVENDIKYRTLLGSMSRSQRDKSLDAFKNDPPTTIFLLSTRAGAVGINLTQANHVVLMEPSFNASLEKQAIGRVYRMGQEREVHVHRLVMKKSIEENMMKCRKEQTANDNRTGSINADKLSAAVAAAYDFPSLFNLQEKENASTPPAIPPPEDAKPVQLKVCGVDECQPGDLILCDGAQAEKIKCIKCLQCKRYSQRTPNKCKLHKRAILHACKRWYKCKWCSVVHARLGHMPPSKDCSNCSMKPWYERCKTKPKPKTGHENT
eukprot:m.62017 g.62017  ORF g.62017 m.62017 type:complete len:1191 (+) comp11477_c0_seq1:243-3815(+)